MAGLISYDFKNTYEQVFNEDLALVLGLPCMVLAMRFNVIIASINLDT